MSDKEKEYGDIPPLFEVDRRSMTVGELIELLQGYPADSMVHVFREHIDGRTRPFIEIKEVSPIFDQDTGKANPGLVLGEIGVLKK